MFEHPITKREERITNIKMCFFVDKLFFKYNIVIKYVKNITEPFSI